MDKRNSYLIGLAVVLGGLVVGLHYLPHAPAAPEDKAYSSDRFGLEFRYPQNYLLREADLPGSGERERHAIVLVDEEEYRRYMASPPEAGEGLPGITVGIYQNNLDHQTAEAWVKNSADSNFKLSNGELREVRVGGMDGVGYRSTGLYEMEHVVVARDRYVYMFTSSFIDAGDSARADLIRLLGSVAFR
jgi:hypothetical protein